MIIGTVIPGPRATAWIVVGDRSRALAAHAPSAQASRERSEARRRFATEKVRDEEREARLVDTPTVSFDERSNLGLAQELTA